MHREGSSQMEFDKKKGKRGITGERLSLVRNHLSHNFLIFFHYNTSLFFFFGSL